jgi:hypothetical protein
VLAPFSARSLAEQSSEALIDPFAAAQFAYVRRHATRIEGSVRKPSEAGTGPLRLCRDRGARGLRVRAPPRAGFSYVWRGLCRQNDGIGRLRCAAQSMIRGERPSGSCSRLSLSVEVSRGGLMLRCVDLRTQLSWSRARSAVTARSSSITWKAMGPSRYLRCWHLSVPSSPALRAPLCGFGLDARPAQTGGAFMCNAGACDAPGEIRSDTVRWVTS